MLCELVDEDVDKAGGQYFVPIMGIDESQLDNIKSGETTLAAEGAVFLDGALQIPADEIVIAQGRQTFSHTFQNILSVIISVDHGRVYFLQ